MRALLALTLLAACSEPNPYYCEGHPDNNCTLDGGHDDDGLQGCTMSSQCSGTAPVCSMDNVCVPCTAHAQCSSAVCLVDGSCANEPDVAYVTASGNDTGSCTKAAPCKTIASALLAGRPHIKLQGNFDEAVVVMSGTVYVHAEPGTTLRRSTTGPILEARGQSTVLRIDDLILRDATGTTGTAISVPPGEGVNLTLDRVYLLNNSANGLNVQGGTLTMSRTVVSGNNAGGAIIMGAFTITSSLFVANGNPVSTTGGLTLAPQTAGSTFKFNTVGSNISSSGSASVRGINCTLPMLISNTIIAGNAAGASCTFSYSLFDTGAASATNLVGDPMFKNIDALTPTAADYFRIMPASPAVDHGDPVSTMTTDIDGDARPRGSAPDIGADESN